MAQCPKCLTELPPDTPAGHCPKCLIGLGLTAEEAPPSVDHAATPQGRRHFAGYELVRQIGCGGMGVVYEAVETDLNRTVAIKVILDAQACSPVARRRFRIEAEAAARLDHPNIVPVYHFGEHEDQPFIAMKLIRGEPLKNKMDRGEIGLPKGGDASTKSALIAGEKAVARLIAEVARAVHHAHAQNVVHRDLKPGNILINTEGTPHLTDFGLAKILDDQHVSLVVSGTPVYMSPEQVRGERVTAAADTWSLGVILYELLTGQRPFHGTSPHETMKAIEEAPPTRPRSLKKHIAPDLETVCLKCLEKKPGDRYGSTADMAEDLERWLRNDPIKARPTGPLARLGRWIKRNPLGASLILSLTLALLSAMGFLHQVREKNRTQQITKARILRDWTRRIDELWEDKHRTNLVISGEEIAILTDRRPLDPAGALRLTFAINITGGPIAEAMAFAPLFEHLQEEMSRTLKRPVIFDLKFCKNYFRFLEVAGGTADFQSMGAVPFWRIKEISPGVQAVVQEKIGKKGVIVARESSPITNSSRFAGKSFGFPDTNATLGLFAKMNLVEAGVNGTNLSFYETIGDLEQLEDVHTVNDETPASPADSSDPLGPAPGTASGLAAARRVRSGSLLVRPDFLDPPSFVQRLRGRADAVSDFLWSQLSTNTQQLTRTNSSSASSELLYALVKDLNRILTNANVLYAPRRFAGVPLSAETRALQEHNPQGEDLIRFNRLLLQDAYPRELAKRRVLDGAVLQDRYLDIVNNDEYLCGPRLLVITQFHVTPNIIASRPNLDPALASAFLQAMLEANKRPEVLESIPKQRAFGGFQQPDTNELDRVRQAMTNEASQFPERRPSPPPPAVPERPRPKFPPE